MRFDVRNRWTGEIQFTAEIDADENTYLRAKIGLALKWAVKNKIVLRDADLSGAVLRGAVLRGADLSGAVLSGAVLSGAVLSGADLSDADLSDADLSDDDLSGEKVSRILASANRIVGGYTFNLFEMQEGPAKIAAGCRYMTIAAYREHVAREYPDSPKATATLAILDYFEAVERANPKQEAAAVAA